MTEFRAAVLTVSDATFRGERNDLSGPAVCESLKAAGFLIVTNDVVPDEADQISAALVRLAKEADLVVTTGGTGIATRDVTPEATRAVCDRLIEGIAEQMRAEGRKQTPFAVLSRGVCGICGSTIILNVPGNPVGARESLESVLHLLPHALNLLRGNTAHPPGWHAQGK